MVFVISARKNNQSIIMGFEISRAGALTGNSNVVVLARDKKKWDDSLVSASEREFVDRELERGVKQVVVNQYDRLVCVQLLEKGRPPATLEPMRKAGHTLASLLNKLKYPSVSILGNGHEEEALAFAEGCFLGSYQFLKYKKDKDKNTNTLHSVRVVTKKRI
jgi:leucyl aminopeptidase